MEDSKNRMKKMKWATGTERDELKQMVTSWQIRKIMEIEYVSSDLQSTADIEGIERERKRSRSMLDRLGIKSRMLMEKS